MSVIECELSCSTRPINIVQNLGRVFIKVQIPGQSLSKPAFTCSKLAMENQTTV